MEKSDSKLNQNYVNSNKCQILDAQARKNECSLLEVGTAESFLFIVSKQ